MREFILGITGASGALIGQRMLQEMLSCGLKVHLIMSRNAVTVYEEEVGLVLGKTHAQIEKNLRRYLKSPKHLEVAPFEDFAAKVSSGSAKMEGMIIAPCSMSTLGAIAHGITLNLIHRAASVSIKEKRPLILVPRESPLSPIHLKNMVELSQIGVHIVPATTAFYHKPKTVDEMVLFTVGRVLDLIKVEHHLFKRWKSSFNHGE